MTGKVFFFSRERSRMVQDFPNQMSSAGCFLILTLRFHLLFVLFCFHTSEKRELFWTVPMEVLKNIHNIETTKGTIMGR